MDSLSEVYANGKTTIKAHPTAHPSFLKAHKKFTKQPQ
jgi:hypothetical protein